MAELKKSLLQVLHAHPHGLNRAALQKLAHRPNEAPWKILRALNALEKNGKIHATGTTRARQYFPGPRPAAGKSEIPLRDSASEGRWVFSKEHDEVVALVARPLHQRKPCSYDRSFLDDYRPNATFYLRERDRKRLHEIGLTPDANQPAGTWARHISERLLIDLSWNSSRLEGNTYSLLDTERLFRDRETAEGHQVRETQMLLNHKQAIEFLVDEAASLKLEVRTLLTLHGMLSENLLPNPSDEGRLRTIVIAIQGSTFHPLAVPQMIEEVLHQLLSTASKINDPFEQSFFLLVHLPYLQPFADVNKRTSRLAANIPLLRSNLHPMSFVDLPREAYTQAILGVYELCRIEALREVYLWGYERSAGRYRAVVKAMGEPDAFRLRYRDSLRELVRTLVQELPPRSALEGRVATLSEVYAPPEHRERFKAVALQELRNLNTGTFHRYRLHPSEFERWVAANT